jgi:hypothetical protein
MQGAVRRPGDRAHDDRDQEQREDRGPSDRRGRPVELDADRPEQPAQDESDEREDHEGTRARRTDVSDRIRRLVVLWVVVRLELTGH